MHRRGVEIVFSMRTKDCLMAFLQYRKRTFLGVAIFLLVAVGCWTLGAILSGVIFFFFFCIISLYVGGEILGMLFFCEFPLQPEKELHVTFATNSLVIRRGSYTMKVGWDWFSSIAETGSFYCFTGRGKSGPKLIILKRSLQLNQCEAMQKMILANKKSASLPDLFFRMNYWGCQVGRSNHNASTQ